MTCRKKYLKIAQVPATTLFGMLGVISGTHAQTAMPAPPAHGLFLGAMDTSVKPCDDFYQYANGKWRDTAVITSEHSSAGLWTDLSERNQAVLHSILDSAAANTHASPGSPEGKVGSFYRSGMNTSRIESDGIKPLQPELDRIAQIHDVVSLQQEIARLHKSGIDAAFGFGVEIDPMHSKDQIASLGQGGMGLPERGYYERTDKETAAIRAQYVEHIAKIMALMGEDAAQAQADSQTIMAFETRLAHSAMFRVDERDPHAVYHPMNLAKLESLTPGSEWNTYFKSIGISSPGLIDIQQDKFISNVGLMMHDVPLDQWKAYLRWHVVNSLAGALNDSIVQENFRFNGTVMRGVPTMRPRWKRVLSATDGDLGEALGKIYVSQQFPPAAKAKALAMVQNLKSVFRDDLQGLAWMGPATRAQAVRKLDAMTIKIGYPDKWRDYSKLDVSSPSYVINEMRSNVFEFNRELAKIGKPVDRTEWGMTPPTVNAYYNPAMNEIVFPAGILQPSFFDAKVDDALNYGAIGAVIGHEMTHGFDDEGRQFDGVGNLRDWWTPADVKNFTLRGQGIVDQYASYEPIPGMHINGKLTEGENIADIGGLKIAYLAFEKSLVGKQRTSIDGFTPEQRFFLAFAQAWREKARPQSEKVGLATDPHSPPRYRVLGAIADTPEFKKAFNCPMASGTIPPTIW